MLMKICSKAVVCDSIDVDLGDNRIETFIWGGISLDICLEI